MDNTHNDVIDVIDEFDEGIKTDVAKARLPYPFFENCLFAATNSRQIQDSYPRNEYGQLEIIRQNKDGDQMTLRSAQPLLACPDMGIFLAVVALAQQTAEPLVGRDSKSVTNLYHAKIKLSELYSLTKLKKRSHYKESLLKSLSILGAVTLSIRRAKPREHKGIIINSYSFQTFWTYDYYAGDGQQSGIIDLFPAKFLVPATKENKLYADAVLCNSLHSDTARALFWALIHANHMILELEQIQKICGTNRQRPNDWISRQLNPALDELRSHGYYVKTYKDIAGNCKWSLKSPSGIKMEQNKKLKASKGK